MHIWISILIVVEQDDLEEVLRCGLVRDGRVKAPSKSARNIVYVETPRRDVVLNELDESIKSYLSYFLTGTLKGVSQISLATLQIVAEIDGSEHFRTFLECETLLALASCGLSLDIHPQDASGNVYPIFRADRNLGS